MQGHANAEDSGCRASYLTIAFIVFQCVSRWLFRGILFYIRVTGRFPAPYYNTGSCISLPLLTPRRTGGENKKRIALELLRLEEKYH